MSEPKTKPNDASPEDFLKSLDNEQRTKDGFTLLKIFTQATKEQPKMWGTSIVGFGSYKVKSANGQEADWPLVAFSPRKQSLTLYVIPETGPSEIAGLLDNLGKHKTSKVCLYINKLDDVDLAVLKQIIKQSYTDSKAKY